MAGPKWEDTEEVVPHWDDTVPHDEAPKTSAGMAALEHYGNAATLGYLPHIQAGLEQLLPNPTADVDEKLRAQGITVPSNTKGYGATRDENIKRLELEGQEHPYASAAGSLGGIVGGGLLTGGAGLGVKGATAGARLLSAGKTGAALGALQNPGDVEGEINPLQFDARLKNTGVGAATGAILQGAVDKIPSLSQKVGSYIRDKAEKRAFKALGPDLRAVRQNYSKDRINDIGRTLLDEGVVGKPTSYQGIADRVGKVKSAKGGDIEKILSGLDSEVSQLNGSGGGQTAGINRKSIAQSLREDLANADSDIPGSAAKNAKIGSLIDEFENGGNDLLGLLETEMKKRKVGKEINWDRLPGADIPVEEQVLRSLYTKLKSGVEDAAGAIEGQTGRTAFKDAKRTYGNLEEAAKIAKGKEQREFANRLLSPTDYLSGGLGAGAGFASGNTTEEKLRNAAIGGSLGLANKLLRTQGNQVIAKGLDKFADAAEIPAGISKLLSENPVAASILSRSSPTIANRVKGSPEFLEKAVVGDTGHENRAPATVLIRTPQGKVKMIPIELKDAALAAGGTLVK